jgi:hypothetical protein
MFQKMLTSFWYQNSIHWKKNKYEPRSKDIGTNHVLHFSQMWCRIRETELIWNVILRFAYLPHCIHSVVHPQLTW